jgi:glycerol-3-phosphate acyltransferase PlsX
MDDPVAQAMRGKKDSSMRVAIDLVKSVGRAAVSAGNTGALMAISRFVLKTLPGIDRPAIAFHPADPRRAIPMCSTSGPMWIAAAASAPVRHHGRDMLVSALEHKERPSVGLLNIGEEDIKGNDVVKQAGELLKRQRSEFPRQRRRRRHLQGHDGCRGLRRLRRQRRC